MGIKERLWKFFWYNSIGDALYSICYKIFPTFIADWLFMWFYEYPAFCGLTDKGVEYLYDMIRPTLEAIVEHTIDLTENQPELEDLADAGYILLYWDENSRLTRAELTEKGKLVVG